MPEVIQVGGEAVGSDPVGPPFDLELEQAEFDADLEDVPAVAGADLSGDHLARAGLIGAQQAPASSPLGKSPPS